MNETFDFTEDGRTYTCYCHALLARRGLPPSAYPRRAAPAALPGGSSVRR